MHNKVPTMGKIFSIPLLLYLSCWTALVFAQSEPTYEVIVEQNVMVKMPDGTGIATDIYRPDAEGTFPAMIERTPYDKSTASRVEDAAYFAKRGYVFIYQDTRGRFQSEGDFYPFLDDAWLANKDGYEAVKWIVEQPWSNGVVGVWGGSHTGQTAYMIGPTQPPGLRAIFARESASDLNAHWVYRGGAFEHGFITAWATGTFGPDLVTKLYEGAEQENAIAQIKAAIETQDKDYWFLPIDQYPAYMSAYNETGGWKFYYDWLAHPNDGPYWWQQSVGLQHHRFEVPVYHVGGWYDIFLNGTLHNYMGIRDKAATPLARSNQKLIVGPWVHGPGNIGQVDVGEMSFPGAETFPDGEELSYATLRRKWFDVWLKDMDTTGFTKEKPVLLYVMGDNVWRFEDDWPLARAQATNFYFHAGNSASIDSLNDGMLSPNKPTDAEPPDSFKYDPLNPIMTIGGNTLFIPNGPRDNRKADERSLTYTSEVLSEDMEVTGPIKAVLYGMSSAVDTDWTVSITDVHPDGRSILIVDGIQRARYRDSRTDPSLIEPDRIYRYEVDLWATSNVFKAGHRIRVNVHSSNFPRWSRNLNIAESPESGARPVVALNTVFHDELRPSHVVLPVIPR